MIKRGRPRKQRTSLPAWAIKYITEISHKTGFTVDQVIEDLLKAGAAALHERYRAIITHRNTIDQMWSQPLTPSGEVALPPRHRASEPEIEGEHVETETEGDSWSPDKDLLARDADRSERERLGHERFSPTEIGPGQLAEGAEIIKSPQPDSGAELAEEVHGFPP